MQVSKQISPREKQTKRHMNTFLALAILHVGILVKHLRVFPALNLSSLDHMRGKRELILTSKEP